jgi:hypothetical protein
MFILYRTGNIKSGKSGTNSGRLITVVTSRQDLVFRLKTDKQYPVVGNYNLEYNLGNMHYLHRTTYVLGNRKYLPGSVNRWRGM